MTEKWRTWHDGEWACLLVRGGGVEATVSLTRLEAAQLREALVEPRKREPFAHGDAAESERLYGLGVGHVLTAEDVKDVQNLIADYNDEIGNGSDAFHDGRLYMAREIGGEALVAAINAKDGAQIKRSVDRAMQAITEASRARGETP